MSNINFEKAPFGLYPCRANMSHKNDSPNLTRKVQSSVKKLVVDRSVNLIYLVVIIHGRPQASIAAIFRQSAGYVFNFCPFRL